MPLAQPRQVALEGRDNIVGKVLTLELEGDVGQIQFYGDGRMMKMILGGSLVVVGLMAAVGGTSGLFTQPLVAGISLLQVGGALVTLLGVAVLVDWGDGDLRQHQQCHLQSIFPQLAGA